MANFEVIEQEKLKMIKATINNETITAEAGALHYMRGNIELKTPTPSAGGFLKSMVTQEAVFRPTYTGTGEIFFGPPSFGEYMVLDVKEPWVLDRGAYICSDSTIEVGAFRNKAMTALMSGEGWFQTKVEGSGKVVLYAQGPIQAIDLVNETLTVDGSFAVARQAKLDFRVQKAAKGLLGSATSGEGLVNVIQGSGRVYLAPVPNDYVSLSHLISSSVYIPSA